MLSFACTAERSGGALDASATVDAPPHAIVDAAADRCPPRRYRDSDGDGFGDPLVPVDVCRELPWAVENADDCNDDRSSQYPHAPELCNAEDDDCDGAVDEDSGCGCDTGCDDGDACNGIETCRDGTNECLDGTPLDCDDEDACTTDTCAPSTGCQHIPLDCDDGRGCTTDSCNASSGCHNDRIDSDGDGEGPSDLGCGSDCDDSNPRVNSSALEDCSNGIDDDCDGLADERVSCYRDGDRDSYPEMSSSLRTCDACAVGYLEARSDGLWDCSDGAAAGSEYAAVHPNQRAWFADSYCPLGVACSGSTGRSFDYDCDGEETRRWTDIRTACREVGGACIGSGWVSSPYPSCGESASFVTCGFDFASRCVQLGFSFVRTQECH